MSVAFSFLLLPFSFVASGCAPSADRVREDVRSGRHRGHVIERVPFVRQAERTCGPAALGVVLAFHGRETPQSEIVDAIYARSIRGTLTFDLPWFAERKGLFATEGGFGFEQVLRFLDQDVPVVALVDPGIWLLRFPHYVVLTGYDEDARCLVLHDGYSPDRVWRVREFLRAWRRTRRWSMVSFPWERDVSGLYDYHYQRLAERAAAEGDPDRAERLFRKAIDENPAARDARHAYAVFLLGRDRAPEAIRVAGECLANARSAAPGRAAVGVPEAENLLAWAIWRAGGDLDRAEALARSAAAAAGGTRSPTALDTLGCVLLARGKSGEAVSALREAWGMRERLSPAERRELGSHYASALRAVGMAGEAAAVESESQRGGEDRRD